MVHVDLTSARASTIYTTSHCMSPIGAMRTTLKWYGDNAVPMVRIGYEVEMK